MKNKTKNLISFIFLLMGFVFAAEAYAAAEFEVIQVGRNVTQGGAFTTNVVGIAGTDVILVNIDVINTGDAATSASTTFLASLPGSAEYQINSTRIFGLSCANFTTGCPIADSASESAFPLDDPYLVGILELGEDFTLQYRMKIAAGTVSAILLEGAVISDSTSGVNGSSNSISVSPNLPPVITLNGSSSINLFVGQAYSEPGATATDETDGNISGNIIIGGVVNTNIPGTYTRTYNVMDSSGNAATTKTRTIIIALDTIRPIITLNGSSTITLVVGNPYTDAGATASDNIQGNITGSIITTNPVSTSTPGTYVVRYNITDSSGNAANEVTRTVQVLSALDTTPPIITLTGSASVTLTTGDTYTDAGATASDNVDGNITANIITTTTVTTSTAGTYTVRYNVTDSSGNAAIEVTRTVVVNAPAAPPAGGGGGGGGSSGGGGGSSGGGGYSGSAASPAPQASTSSTPQVVGGVETTSGSVVTEFIFLKDLAFDDTGTEVTELQKRLLSEGFYSGAIQGSFDAATLQAVKSYQKTKGIIANGYVGSRTRAELNKEKTPEPAFTRNLTLGMSGADVTALQTQLAEAKVYNGPITGYFGNLTLAAVKRYQAAKKIFPQSGYVGPLTRLALNTASPTPSLPTPAPQTYIVETKPAPVNVAETQQKINTLQAQLLNLLKLLEEAIKR
ncbi:DUF5011 domain-containing protein [Candidatus Kaiserbacteria bacterium]|nr:DUF5011 domain-containing protein [Candidatus Kaiserbacteria bacterium]